MRMQSLLPKKIKENLKTSDERASENRITLNATSNNETVKNDTNVVTDYTLKNTFIDLYLHIGNKNIFQDLDFRQSYLSYGEWIVSHKTSSELYRVERRFMNSVNEWDPGKHGWFRTVTNKILRKTSHIRNRILHTPVETLQNYLNLKVQNCKKQSFQAYFHGTTSTSALPLVPLNSSPSREGHNSISSIQENKYQLRKRTNVLSITRTSYLKSNNKMSLNLAIVTKGGPFKLYPSVNESLLEKEYIDSSFNATVKMDEDGNTWLLLDIGSSCGRLISGDVRNKNDRSILTR